MTPARAGAVTALCAALALNACTPERPPDDAAAPSPTAASPSPTPTPTPVKRKLVAIGHSRLGGGGFNADVYGFGRYAFVGVWGGTGFEAACPASGVKVADLKNPRRPRRVSRLRNPDGTTAEDVVVARVRTRSFRGVLAAVGIQPCGLLSARARGLQFFDVTRPRRPRELGFWSAPSVPGCHEIDLRGGRRPIAACASPGAATTGNDEAVLVDVRDPRQPRTIGGFRLDVDARAGIGCFRRSVAHSVRFAPDRHRLYVSYWDAGVVVLNIRRPARPAVRRIIKPPSVDGDTHSVAFAGDLVLVNLEDFSPALPGSGLPGCSRRYGGWGRIYVYRGGRLLAKFGTRNSKRRRPPNRGIYTVHNTEIVDRDQVFASWYADGVRWIDLSRPRRPRQVARFVPPRTTDPHGFFPPLPHVWGVYPVRGTDLVLASDINSGLWVLRAVGLTDR